MPNIHRPRQAHNSRTSLSTTDDEFGPFGAKGVGEPGSVPTAPAIGNAVYKAVGIRIHDLPITPEKVLRALKQKRMGGRSVPESESSWPSDIVVRSVAEL